MLFQKPRFILIHFPADHISSISLRGKQLEVANEDHYHISLLKGNTNQHHISTDFFSLQYDQHQQYYGTM